MADATGLELALLDAVASTAHVSDPDHHKPCDICKRRVAAVLAVLRDAPAEQLAEHGLRRLTFPARYCTACGALIPDDNNPVVGECQQTDDGTHVHDFRSEPTDG